MLRFSAVEDNRTRIAFCGTRGLPANYGGFETAVDEITRRFVAEGHEVEVFCRRSTGATRHTRHEGRRLVYVDGHKSRKLDTFVAAIQTGRHLWKHRNEYKHVFWFNNANLPGIILTALAGIPMSVNTDGLEWRRGKWSWPFKAYYYLSSQFISLICRRLVSDSCGIQSYYRKHFFRKTEFIPYGAPSGREASREQTRAILDRFDLEAGKYLLQITRIEPDNLPLETVMAFAKSSLPASGMAMVVVGYKDPTPYARKLKLFDGRFGVRICDALYDQEVLHVLRSNCFAYVHGNSVGGTNPALLEAMATCPRVLAIDCEFSHEVLDGAGTYFDPSDPGPAIEAVVNERDRSHELRNEVQNRYQWDAVACSYMNLAAGARSDYTPTGETTTTAAAPRECETTGVGK